MPPRLLPDIILRYTLNVSQMSLKCYSFDTLTETMHIDPHLLKRTIMPSPLSSLQGEERLAHSCRQATSRQAVCCQARRGLASRSAPRNAFSDACTGRDYRSPQGMSTRAPWSHKSSLSYCSKSIPCGYLPRPFPQKTVEARQLFLAMLTGSSRLRLFAFLGFLRSRLFFQTLHVTKHTIAIYPI